MKSNTTTIAKAVILGLVISVGVGYISAAWNEPTLPPTDGNTDAPLHTGGSVGVNQTKTGGIWASFLGSTGNAIINGTLQILGGTPGAGKVLTSDATGIASWQTAGGAVKWLHVYGFSQDQHFTPNTTITVPEGVTRLIISPTVRMACNPPADNGRTVRMEFKAQQGSGSETTYAAIESGAGTNNVAEARIQASTNGVLPVTPGTLTLSALSQIFSGQGTLQNSSPWNGQGSYGQNCSSSMPNYYSSFKGYIIYGY